MFEFQHCNEHQMFFIFSKSFPPFFLPLPFLPSTLSPFFCSVLLSTCITVLFSHSFCLCCFFTLSNTCLSCYVLSWNISLINYNFLLISIFLSNQHGTLFYNVYNLLTHVFVLNWILLKLKNKCWLTFRQYAVCFCSVLYN